MARLAALQISVTLSPNLAVIQAGEAIMLIVPVTDELTVEARIEPQDIDQVTPGQAAVLRLSFGDFGDSALN